MSRKKSKKTLLAEMIDDPGEQGHPSWDLCRELAGSWPGGNLGDLGDCLACYLEEQEGPSAELPADPVTLEQVTQAIALIRSVVDRAEARINELACAAKVIQ